jgi:hypothetical protein
VENLNSEMSYEGLDMRLLGDNSLRVGRTRLTYAAPAYPYIMRLSVLNGSIYAEHTVKVVSNAEIEYLSSHIENHEGLG